MALISSSRERMKTTLPLIGFVLTLVLATPQTASAYTDPGSGALLYQMAYAGFLAGAFCFRRLLDRVWGKRKQ
jgi:hypothetical protein